MRYYLLYLWWLWSYKFWEGIITGLFWWEGITFRGKNVPSLPNGVVTFLGDNLFTSCSNHLVYGLIEGTRDSK